MFRFDVLPPLALYLHLPWCVRKCPYCDFNSHELKSDLPEQAYVDALLADIEFELPGIWGRTVQSIFIGGGTPSLFSPEAIDRLLAGVRSRLRCKPALEITLEANPGTVEQGRFAEYRAAGVNRLSIGVQSFQPDLLERLGRIHDRREAMRAAESAHRAGLENFNLDLMFGLPGQKLAACLADVATAMDLEPAHISFYQLTLEPNTRFHRYPPVLPEEDIVWTMQEQGRAALEAGGYTQYEISAYARPGRQCDHNLNYWRFGDYLGIGAGAHGKVTDAQRQAVTRRWKIKHPKDYVRQAGTAQALGGESVLRPADAVLEFMMNGLRLNEGFTAGQFEAGTGLALESAAAAIEQGLTAGLLERHDTDRLRASATGRQFLNDLLALFLPEEGADDRRDTG
ncbi:MAG TPA: radical SAM family heme chaperone HemW [Gammaproteobacteria bacterium]|nr:radical SAM family heme chaperone HemW [Gammaproteobacteria bacterium]